MKRQKLSLIKEKLEVLKQKTFLISHVQEEEKKRSLIEEIKTLLETASTIIKGELFEHYVTYLYEGNGYLAKHNGGNGDHGADILLYNAEDTEQVDIIVQTKNLNHPLTYKETKSELIQFEKDGSECYQCYQYILISMNGFVKDCERLQRYNMKMVAWDYVEDLILSFTEQALLFKKGQIRLELKAHNQVAYEEITQALKKHDLLAVVRATGTGKSYLITELLHDYDEVEKLVLAPSHHILDDLENKFKLGKQENVSYLTYQKIIQMNEEELSMIKAKLIIFDEFHRLGADKWGAFANRLKWFNQGAKIVGFSATPIRFLDDNRNMVEEFFEGHQIEELNLAEAIVRHILPTPTYISSLYTLEEEIKSYEERINQSFMTEAESQESQQQLKQISKDWENVYGVDKILAKYLPQTHKNLKFIVFCEDIEHLNDINMEVAKWFNKALNQSSSKIYKDIRAYRIHSNTDNNKSTLERFINNRETNTIDLMFSVNMFNEGLHVKGITGVILLRKTMSPTIYYQQIGRALAVGNHHPIIFDFVNNFDYLKADNGYDLGKALDQALRDEQEQRKNDDLPDNLPNILMIDLLSEAKTLLQRIDSYLKNSWEFRYEQLKEFFIENNHCNVPDRYRENKALGTWVSNQRKAYKKGTLSQDKIELLNELNFDWDRFETQWNQMYEELSDFFGINGHSNVPKRYTENQALGKWVGKQRQDYKKGALSQHQLKLLNELNFDWNPFESQWNQMYQQLREFFEINGHSNAPKRCTENKALGYWVGTQRKAYKEGSLPEDKIELLNELNFDWNSLETHWNQMYQQLKEFFIENNHCNVPDRYTENKILGTWVINQRKAYKEGMLSEDRIELLNELNFDWNPLETQWNSMYQQLKEFFIENNHCNVPKRYTENKALGTWIGEQRKAYKKD
ncbi:Helicase associated domain protein, partial [Turicibacter sanguinis]|uniref:Helicase associated domain protein n=1 Tax=Turicibacter sanguinis TaxID=154288 RepID=UPI00232BB2B7